MDNKDLRHAERIKEYMVSEILRTQNQDIDFDDCLDRYIEQEVSLAYQRCREEMRKECLAVIPLWMTYYDDLTQQDYREWYNQWVDDSRTAINSIK